MEPMRSVAINFTISTDAYRFTVEEDSVLVGFWASATAWISRDPQTSYGYFGSLGNGSVDKNFLALYAASDNKSYGPPAFSYVFLKGESVFINVGSAAVVQLMFVPFSQEAKL